MENNNISIIKREDCTGCSACASKCPQKCISMLLDAMGFPYPSISENDCIHCGLCLKVCELNILQKNLADNFKQKIYAARNKDLEILKSSSSGGVFSAISDYVLDLRGVVVGAVFDEDGLSVHHAFATTKEERNLMRGSKYTYSSCSIDTFAVIEDFLKSGRFLLFTGTPCQVAALKSSLGVNYPNLITCDLLCHGVESPAVFRDFSKEMSKYKKIYRIDFRQPMYDNWHEARTVIHYKDGSTRSGNNERSYFMCFVQDLGLRPACLHCKFCSFERCGDITLGDFHGIENTPIKMFDHPNGCSVVLVNTEKGADLLNHASHALEIVESERKHCTHNQLNGLPPILDKSFFSNDYLNHGWKYVKKKYGMPSFKIRVLQSLYSFLWIRKLRNMIKK